MAQNEQESVFKYAARLLGIGQQPPNKASADESMISSGTMQSQPVSSGSASAGGMSPQQEQRAREEEARLVAEAGMAAPAPATQQPMVSPGGLGVIAIQPNAEEMYVYPEQRYRKKFEEDQSLFDKNSKKRIEANTQMALLLASPQYYKMPAHVREADAAAMKAMLDQVLPLPTPANTFTKDFPEVQKLASSIETPYRRRVNAVAELSGQVERINDVFRQYGKDSPKAVEILVPELMGMLKVYNTALSGTSDALSQAEVGRLSPELNPNIFDLAKANKIGGKVFGSNVEAFRRKLESLHDILIRETNMAWNTLAAQSSPEFANGRLGAEFGRPYGAKVPARFGKDIPKSVATGAVAYSDYLTKREAMFADLLPRAEQAKTQILSSALPYEEKAARLKELNRRFNQQTGRSIQLPDEFLIPAQ